MVQRGRQTPGRHARQVAIRVVHDARKPQSESCLIGFIIKGVQSNWTVSGARTVFTASVILRHARTVVASGLVGTSAEFVFVTNAVAVLIVEAVSVTIDVHHIGINATAVLHICTRIVVASTRI